MMKNISTTLILIFISLSSYAAETNTRLNMTCQDYSWSDIETLVQPYLDDTLFTALVMQGQSSNYKASEAARQAMDDSLPNVVKHILRAIIKANC